MCKLQGWHQDDRRVVKCRREARRWGHWRGWRKSAWTPFSSLSSWWNQVSSFFSCLSPTAHMLWVSFQQCKIKIKYVRCRILLEKLYRCDVVLCSPLSVSTLLIEAFLPTRFVLLVAIQQNNWIIGDCFKKGTITQLICTCHQTWHQNWAVKLAFLAFSSDDILRVEISRAWTFQRLSCRGHNNKRGGALLPNNTVALSNFFSRKQGLKMILNHFFAIFLLYIDLAKIFNLQVSWFHKIGWLCKDSFGRARKSDGAQI